MALALSPLLYVWRARQVVTSPFYNTITFHYAFPSEQNAYYHPENDSPLNNAVFLWLYDNETLKR